MARLAAVGWPAQLVGEWATQHAGVRAGLRSFFRLEAVSKLDNPCLGTLALCRAGALDVGDYRVCVP